MMGLRDRNFKFGTSSIWHWWSIATSRHNINISPYLQRSSELRFRWMIWTYLFDPSRNVSVSTSFLGQIQAQPQNRVRVTFARAAYDKRCKSNQILSAQNTSHLNAASGKSSWWAGPTRLKRALTVTLALLLRCGQANWSTDWMEAGDSGVTMRWLLRLVTGGGTGGRGPPTVQEFLQQQQQQQQQFLVINFSVCLVLLSNCYIIIYCIVWFQVQPLMVVFQ